MGTYPLTSCFWFSHLGRPWTLFSFNNNRLVLWGTMLGVMATLNILIAGIYCLMSGAFWLKIFLYVESLTSSPVITGFLFSLRGIWIIFSSALTTLMGPIIEFYYAARALSSSASGQHLLKPNVSIYSHPWKPLECDLDLVGLCVNPPISPLLILLTT